MVSTMNSEKPSYDFLTNFSANDSPLCTYMKEVFENNDEGSDLVFISKENFKIYAHKLVLGFSLPFIRDLFQCHPAYEFTSCISLPDFSARGIKSFLSLFYTGVLQICLNTPEHEEFLALCKHFNCEDITVVSELKCRLEEGINSSGSKIFAETLFFSANNDDFSTQKHEKIKEEYLQEEYLTENQTYEMPPDQKYEVTLVQTVEDFPECQMSTSSTLEDEEPPAHKKFASARQKDPKPSVPPTTINLSLLRNEQEKFKKRLQEAINYVRDSYREDSNSVKKASKMFGVPTSAIERNLKGYKRLHSYQP